MPGRSESFEPAVLDLRSVGEARKHAEYVRIRLAAAESEAADDRERHLVATVGED